MKLLLLEDDDLLAESLAESLKTTVTWLIWPLLESGQVADGNRAL